MGRAEVAGAIPGAGFEIVTGDARADLEAKGDRAGAIAELEAAMETWAPADEAYAHARRAREKVAELRECRSAELGPG